MEILNEEAICRRQGCPVVKYSRYFRTDEKSTLSPQNATNQIELCSPHIATL